MEGLKNSTTFVVGRNPMERLGKCRSFWRDDLYLESLYLEQPYLKSLYVERRYLKNRKQNFSKIVSIDLGPPDYLNSKGLDLD